MPITPWPPDPASLIDPATTTLSPARLASTSCPPDWRSAKVPEPPVTDPAARVPDWTDSVPPCATATSAPETPFAESELKSTFWRTTEPPEDPDVGPPT